ALESIMDESLDEEYLKLLFVGSKIYPKSRSTEKYSGFSKNYFYLETGIVDPYENNEGVPCFGLYTMVTFSDNEKGYLYEEIPMDYIKDFYLDYLKSDGTYAYLISITGDILSCSDDAILPSGTDSFYQLLKDNDPENGRKSIIGIDNDVMDRKQVSASFKLKDAMNLVWFTPVNGTNWCLVTVIPRSVYEEEMNRVVLNMINLIIIILVVCLLLAAVYFSKLHKDQREEQERLSKEKRLMVSAVSTLYSLVLEIDLSSARVTVLFDDTRLGIDFSLFSQYEDIEKLILKLSSFNYHEKMSEMLELRALRKNLTNENTSISCQSEFVISDEKYPVSIDVTLSDPENRIALYFIKIK
ncbi:MAG: hypothetical protein MJ123_09380, partial [Lachnospiraceae bacterium]|nr:hypothetical protein [Lachnospiraceae bacterium]